MSHPSASHPHPGTVPPLGGARPPGTASAPAIPSPSSAFHEPAAPGETPNTLAPLVETLAIRLAPFFHQATADTDLARTAARAVLMETPPGSALQLILTAQIVAFSLAALGTLSQCMQQDTPAETIAPETIASLCIGAEKLSRAADRARRALLQTHRHTSQAVPQAPAAPQPPERAEPPAARPRPAPSASPAAAPGLPASGTAPPQNDWGNVFASLANELAGSLPELAPASRGATSLRAAALSSTASVLMTRPPAQPPLAR